MLDEFCVGGVLCFVVMLLAVGLGSVLSVAVVRAGPWRVGICAFGAVIVRWVLSVRLAWGLAALRIVCLFII